MIMPGFYDPGGEEWDTLAANPSSAPSRIYSNSESGASRMARARSLVNRFTGKAR
jgi:hypothetical protein